MRLGRCSLAPVMAEGMSPTSMRALIAACAVRVAAFMHGPQIMFGVLQVILRRDKIAALGFGAGQLQIALVFPLRILGMHWEANIGGLVAGLVGS